jgi:hypothetical protein
MPLINSRFIASTGENPVHKLVRHQQAKVSREKRLLSGVTPKAIKLIAAERSIFPISENMPCSTEKAGSKRLAFSWLRKLSTVIDESL